MDHGAFIVIDIGKTTSKVSLWTRDGRMLDRQTRPNAPCAENGISRLDVEGIGEWITGALSSYSGHRVEAIIPVGHGAAVAALANDRLAFAPLDYEQPVPGHFMAAYRRERDPFAVSGSPALPDGLNLGAQIFWLERLYPEVMAKATLLPWAQYWAWFLSGKAASEVSSLGCHSDLWQPARRDFSPMAKRLGWAERFAPLAAAGDVIGTLKPDLALATGLSEDIRIVAGVHDSNAALLAARGFPEIAKKEATVLSTGTWFIAMRLPGSPVEIPALPEARDCLVNVDVFAAPVPSARFMGGREIETLIELDTRRVDIKPDQPALLAAVDNVIADGARLLPTFARGFGPFPHGEGRWIRRPEDWYARRAAACLYAALVADCSLDLVGSRECLLIEGRFAEAEVFVRALASLRPGTRVYTANAHNDVSFGALRLIVPELKPRGDLVPVEPLPADLTPYRECWLANIGVPA